MKKFFLLTLLLFLSVCLSAQPVKIDEEKATVNFMFSTNDIGGTISGLTINSALDFENLETSSISGTVVAETIDTNKPNLNKHLRKYYFKVEDFPELSFKSDAITTAATAQVGYFVSGTLTIKKFERPVRFMLTKGQNQLTLKTTIYSSDYNIIVLDERYRNKVDIEIILPYSF